MGFSGLLGYYKHWLPYGDILERNERATGTKEETHCHWSYLRRADRVPLDLQVLLLPESRSVIINVYYLL